MQNNQNKINLLDLVDVNFLQKLQDKFADAVGIASLMVDDNGPITKPSNFCDFCSHQIRASKLGSIRCNESDIEGGRLAMEKGKPVIYTCHAGLTDFVVPIIVQGQHVASFLSGQFSLTKIDENHFKDVAKALGLNKQDEKKYIEDLRKIKIVPEAIVKSAADLLFLVANTISEIAHKNYELIEQNKQEVLLRDINEKIRGSFNIDEMLKFICVEIASLFKVQRSVIVSFLYPENYEISIVRNDYRTSSKIKGVVDAELTNKISIFWTSNVSKNNKVLAYDNIGESDVPDYFKNAYEQLGVKSAMGAPIRVGNKLWGVLVLFDYKNYRCWTDKEKSLLETIATQIYIAINQAELFQNAKNRGDRETILRKITNEIRSSLDFEKIKYEIVNQIGRFLNADRVVVAYYDYKIGNYIITKDSEYRSSDKIKTFVGVDFTSIPGFAENVRDSHFKGNNIIFNDLDEYLDENNLKDTGVENFYRYFGYQASAAINIYYENEFLGDLVISYGHSKSFSGEEIDFLKAIADQVGVAFHQADLYKKTVDQAEREKALRKIVNIIRTSLDINEIKKMFVEETAKYFNANRCFIYEFGPKIKPGICVEYTSSPEIKKMALEGFTKPQFKFLEDIMFKKDIMAGTFCANCEKYIVDNNLQNSPADDYRVEYDIKTVIGIPIVYAKRLYGSLIIQYTEKSIELSDEDSLFLESLAEQAAIAFNQAELYAVTRQQADREALLRKITFTIRTSLDLEETFNIICSEIAKISVADRVTISEMPNDLNTDVIRSEFKFSENIKGLKDVISIEKSNVFEYITNYVFSKNGPLIINNMEESDAPDFVKDFYKNLDVKSLIIFPIKKGKDKWGVLLIAHVKEYKFWDESEITLIGTILEQIYIAIKQAEMYEETLLIAKREALVRSIIEKIRSSLDLEDTLTFICEETARLFNAQRSSIIVFPDKHDYKRFELRKEYKESLNTMGYDQITDIASVAEYWGHALSTVNKVIAINNIEESEVTDSFKSSYAVLGVKSAIGTLINNGKDIWGDLILSDYDNTRIWSDEDKSLLNTISHQIYIAINQAELYEKEKIMLERERISRNIIEILRSSIDKTIIKKLFVKNIGKFFDADRVFFSEYDSDSKVYLPVDNDSEYLSNISEKSFVGFDWSNPEIIEHIQPLLERREVKIPDWGEYLTQHSNISDSFRALYEDSGVKSSYSFPVLYQDKTIGYFCLEFTKKVCKISDEDIGRIRSICTQAGIALYHADLYLKAQEFTLAKDSIVSEFFEKIKTPANTILDSSILLYENEFERPIQIEYLNNIIISCNQLLELTKNVSEN